MGPPSQIARLTEGHLLDHQNFNDLLLNVLPKNGGVYSDLHLDKVLASGEYLGRFSLFGIKKTVRDYRRTFRSRLIRWHHSTRYVTESEDL